MKKIVSILMVILVAATLSAEVKMGGWIESHGTMYSKSGDADAVVGFGKNLFALNAEFNNGSYGGYIDTSAFAFGDIDSYTEESLGEFVNIGQAYAWHDFGTTGLFTIYGGNGIEVLDYSPDTVFGILNDDGMGWGFGKYNYERNDALNTNTFAVDGLVVEAMVGPVTLGLTYAVPGADSENYGAMTATFEDTIDECYSINAKYFLPGFGKVFAGYAPASVAVETFDMTTFTNVTTYEDSFWVAASIKAVPGLLADVKFEQVMTETASSNLTLNLGYKFNGLVDTKSETNVGFSGSEFESVKALAVLTPLMVPVVGLDIEAGFANHQTMDWTTFEMVDTTGIGVGLKVSKGVGVATTSLSIKYTKGMETYSGDADGTFSIGYTVSCPLI